MAGRTLACLAAAANWGSSPLVRVAAGDPAFGDATACANGCARVRQVADEEVGISGARTEFLQTFHTIELATDAVNKAPPQKLSQHLITWFHAPRTGSSFLYTLLQQEELCPPPFDMNRHESLNMKLVRKHCPGIWQSRTCSSKIAFNMCAETALGPEYETFRGGIMGFFRQPEQRLMSDWSWECNAGGACPPAKTFARERAGCVTKMIAWADGVPSHCSGSTEEPTWQDVALAKYRIINDFIFVGMTEQWDLSICLFNAMFGSMCQPSQFAEYENYDVRHATTNGSTEVYDTSRLDGYEDPYDVVLWDTANEIFNRNLRVYGVRLESCQPC